MGSTMQIRTLLATRVAHVGGLTVAVVAVLYLTRGLSPVEQSFVTVLPIIAWYFGVLYEQSLVLVNGLVDKDELDMAEQEASRFFR